MDVGAVENELSFSLMRATAKSALSKLLGPNIDQSLELHHGDELGCSFICTSMRVYAHVMSPPYGTRTLKLTCSGCGDGGR